MFTKFTQWFERPPHQRTTPGKKCDSPGCEAHGIYRAPKSRHHIEQGQDDWHWFCLSHVRLYNASWNYYADMNESEVLKANLADQTWQRPTWPLGEQPKIHKIKDPFGFFFVHESSGASFQKIDHLPKDERQALEILELAYPFTKEDLQTAYRKLVKTYHPDTHQNDPNAEDKIRQVNQAYALLKSRL
ncbi:MAG TPA: J domain-containing protein [Candidatus Nitrosotenuis sp.]|jgi:hypothetical protein|nr:J domain-containing protein [Candidatus Nitrosotenuis sp.]